MNYKISPVAVDGFANADGVHENQYGAWLGETDYRQVEPDGKIEVAVVPYSDEDGDFIPAPANWRDLIIEEL